VAADVALDREPAAGGAGDGDLPAWDLGDLYESPDSGRIGRDLSWLETACVEFAARFEGKLAEAGSADIEAALADYEAVSKVAGRLSLYAGLRFRQDMQDAERGRFLADIETRLSEATRPLVFFSLELNRIEDRQVEQWLAASDSLRRYRVWLQRLRARRPHQLSAELETYAHDFSPVGRSAWRRLFAETVAALRFSVDGSDLTLEAALNLLLDPEGGRRESAFRAIASTLGQNRQLFARIANTLVQSRQIEDRWRKFREPQSARHLANDIEPEIVEALRSAVTGAYQRIPHRYYKLKAQWMGQATLSAWDRNAPLPGQGDRRFSWAEARGIVERAFGAFSPVMVDLVQPFFDKGWCDAAPLPGKYPGAFSAGGPSDVHPYVLVNYQGRGRDVTTLAHELGHAVHQSLARAQGELLADTPLTFAETASVFAEMLVFRKLLEEEPKPAARRALLAGKAEDMINTVFRQMSFHEFEVGLHAARKKGELPADRIGEIWMQATGAALGPAVRLNDGFQDFWTYVPHFVDSPFYVYAYAFGDALVNALYGVYLQRPEGFAERYLDLLRAGGSLRHPELLRPFGLDLRDPDFWNIGLDLIDGIISEAEAIEV